MRKQQVSSIGNITVKAHGTCSHITCRRSSRTQNFRGFQSCHFIITACCYSQKHKEVHGSWKGFALWETWCWSKNELEKCSQVWKKGNMTNSTSSSALIPFLNELDVSVRSAGLSGPLRVTTIQGHKYFILKGSSYFTLGWLWAQNEPAQKNYDVYCVIT